MNEERLNALFQEIRDEKAETSVQDVSKWIAISAASAGLFGLLAQFKLPILLTKKIIIMTSIALSVGIGATALFLSMNTAQTAQEVKVKQAKIDYTLKQSVTLINNEVPETTISQGKTDEEPQSILPTIEKIPLLGLTDFEKPQSNSPKPLEQPTLLKNEQTRDGNEIKVDDFEQVHVSGTLDVYITLGDVNSVRLEGTEAEIARVEATVKRGELHLSQVGKNNNQNSSLIVHITMVKITGVGVSGAASIKSTMMLHATDMDVQGTGAGDINLELNCDNIKIEGTGAANITLIGTTNKLNIEATGACNISCYKLETNEIDLVATGAANVEVKAKNRLFMSATGASHVSYKGNPINISKTVSTAAKISKRI